MNPTEKELKEFIEKVKQPYMFFTIYFFDEGHWYYTQSGDEKDARETYAELRKEGIKYIFVVKESVNPKIISD